MLHRPQDCSLPVPNTASLVTKMQFGSLADEVLRSERDGMRCRHVLTRVCGRRWASNAIPREESPYGDRSAVTRLLWDERLKVPPKNALQPLEDKTPADSFMQLELPFSHDAVLREQYISPFGHVRIGRLLEDLDAFAGNVAFRHAFPSRPTIVTASLDKLDLLPRAIDPNQDLRIAGGVTSVGNSSMEIRIDAFQGPGWPTILTTYFTMVALDPMTKKATPINPLVVHTEEEKKRKLEGDRNKEERLEAKRQSLHVRTPTTEEFALIHEFFMKDTKGTAAGARQVVPMADTHQRSMIFCSHQSRNIHGKIFGGYLLRKAFELGFSTAYLFAGRRPFFSALGDVTFNNSVAIGALLDLRSAVVYTERSDIQVHVSARVHLPEEGSVVRTNDFAFTFDLYEDDHQTPLRCPKAVKPMAYAEAMSFITGRRALHRHKMYKH